MSLPELTHQLADDGELPLFKVIQKYLAGARYHGTYLDVGCGTGRIITMFAGLFDHATCLEADPARISEAQRHWKDARWGRTKTMHFENVRFGLEYNGIAVSVDAISCIQVVQHIPGFMLRLWLANMFGLLKPRGFLIIATTHRKKDMFGLVVGVK